ncbi:hypothetical protein VC83_05613 [Pseudogymnoascus destructans]|uniref:Uncharacterized protein n=1 Tax=Pseudogymnoascus destructans TaxID=655981 RepID=A0A177A851_9PEZI|nr:uncharacterized protein VC83_05613 [Pseudogymnoascus destructans]OAF57612.1 hypothetical protein VC83_05613 [Pseudogymnoascus destructans]
MVMKRHRQGLDYSSLIKPLSYNVWSWVGPDEIKASARIVDGSLLLRQQHVLLVHPNSDFFVHPRHHHDLPARRAAPVDVDRTPTAVECECCAHQGEMDEGNWSGMIICCDCATEFGIGQEGKVFVVTRWKDLGEGRDGNDPVWRAHLMEPWLGGGSGRRAGGRTIY